MDFIHQEIFLAIPFNEFYIAGDYNCSNPRGGITSNHRSVLYWCKPLLSISTIMVPHIWNQLKYIECYLDRRAIVTEMRTSGVTDELYKKFFRLDHISLDISEKIGKISKLKKALEELKLLSKDVKASCQGFVTFGAWRDFVLDPLTSYSKMGAEDDLFSEKVQNGQLSDGEIVVWNAELQRVSDKLVDSHLSEEKRAKWRVLLRVLEEGEKEVREKKSNEQVGRN